MEEVLESAKSHSESLGVRPKARYKSGSPEMTENESIHPAAQSANEISRKVHSSAGISRICWVPHSNEARPDLRFFWIDSGVCGRVVVPEDTS